MTKQCVSMHNIRGERHQSSLVIINGASLNKETHQKSRTKEYYMKK